MRVGRVASRVRVGRVASANVVVRVVARRRRRVRRADRRRIVRDVRRRRRHRRSRRDIPNARGDPSRRRATRAKDDSGHEPTRESAVRESASRDVRDVVARDSAVDTSRPRDFFVCTLVGDRTRSSARRRRFRRVLLPDAFDVCRDRRRAVRRIARRFRRGSATRRRRIRRARRRVSRPRRRVDAREGNETRARLRVRRDAREGIERRTRPRSERRTRPRSERRTRPRSSTGSVPVFRDGDSSRRDVRAANAPRGRGRGHRRSRRGIPKHRVARSIPNARSIPIGGDRGWHGRGRRRRRRVARVVVRDATRASGRSFGTILAVAVLADLVVHARDSLRPRRGVSRVSRGVPTARPRPRGPRGRRASRRDARQPDRGRRAGRLRGETMRRPGRNVGGPDDRVCVFERPPRSSDRRDRSTTPPRTPNSTRVSRRVETRERRRRARGGVRGPPAGWPSPP